jgi:hypothetical protein
MQLSSLACLVLHSSLKKRLGQKRKIPGQNSRTREIQPSGQLPRRGRRIFLQHSLQDLSLSVHFGFLQLSDLSADGPAKIGNSSLMKPFSQSPVLALPLSETG